MLARIENLRLRAIALRSSVHNEHQLSAIELTAMCAKKTNELIDVINELCEVVDNLNEAVTLIEKYNAETESLTLETGVKE